MKSPFKFLDAYTVADKDTFFGRDKEIEILYNTVYKTPLVLVYGSSGTGKTSLIQCGLGNRFDGPDWYPVFIRRNDNINTSIREVMTEILGEQATGDLKEDASFLLRKSLRPVYLLFDQFEELFIRGNEEEQLTFMHSLRALLDVGLACKVVLIMREEFIARLYAYENLIPELFDHRIRVEIMGPSKVKEVISSSFEKFNIHLDEPKEELLELMISKINDSKSGIALPYLQVYLDMLYNDVYQKKIKGDDAGKLPFIQITKEDIQSLGQINDVLERFLENQTKALQKNLAAQYPLLAPKHIQSILNVFVTDEGTKNPVTYKMDGEHIVLSDKASLLLKDISPEMLTAIITSLVNVRILRKDSRFLEVAHDSLAFIINKRKSATDRLLRNIQKRILNAYEEYKSTGAFLNNKQLAAFDEFRAQLMLSPELEKFLADCENEIIRKEKVEQERTVLETKMAQQKKIARIQTILLIIIGLVIIGSSWGFIRYQSYLLDQENKEKDAEDAKIRYANLQKIAEQQSLADTYKDSLTEIRIQIYQQIGKIDSFISKVDKLKSMENLEFVFSDIPATIETIGYGELERSIVTLNSLFYKSPSAGSDISKNNATITNAVISAQASLPAESSNNQSQNISDTSLVYKRDSIICEIGDTSPVYLHLKLRPGISDEYIQVKWYDKDTSITAEPSYYLLKKKSASQEWITIPKYFDKPDVYIAEIYNSLGYIIGSIKFSVNSQINTEIGEIPFFQSSSNTIKVKDFITMKNGTLKNPGPSDTIFYVGDRLYYWARLISPINERVFVQLLDNNTIIFSDSFEIEKNEEIGYRIINWRSVNKAGSYTLKLINQNKDVLDSQIIQVKEIDNR